MGNRTIEVEFLDPTQDEITTQSASLLMLPFIPTGVAYAPDDDMMAMASQMTHRVTIGEKTIKDRTEIEQFFKQNTFNITAMNGIAAYMEELNKTESKKKTGSGKNMPSS